ncbi:MAG: tetratricopeptide repeat protein [Bacteroidetes bacterium]|nr:tetratricopeptide repeat protein [Bacteroidota bacterium]
MKKILILFSLSFLISIGSYAQNNKRTSAYMYNKNKQYDKAMNAIDEAILNPKTEKDSKTWMYRGIIYYNIANDTSAAVRELSPEAANISVESFAKALEYDEKGGSQGEIALYLLNLTNIFYQRGADGFMNSDFESAVTNFKQAFDIAQIDNRFDTIAAFNVGMSGIYSDNPEIAAEYLKKCVDASFMDPRVYLFYSRAEKQLGDTSKTFEILSQGRELFPNDNSLQLEEAQLYLETGENDKLIKSLKEAIASDPTNPNLYRVIGQTYENVGDIDSAIENYKKAVEINPDFGDAIFNIGAIYVNNAAVLYTEANNLPYEEMEKYNKLKGEADAYLYLALPYLEKSLELNPDDKVVIGALKEAYANLKMNDKLKELMNK